MCPLASHVGVFPLSTAAGTVPHHEASRILEDIIAQRAAASCARSAVDTRPCLGKVLTGERKKCVYATGAGRPEALKRCLVGPTQHVLGMRLPIIVASRSEQRLIVCPCVSSRVFATTQPRLANFAWFANFACFGERHKITGLENGSQDQIAKSCLFESCAL